MLIYCCADLIFATKIRATADAAGVVSRPARNAEMLQKRLDQVDDGKPNAPVSAAIIDLDMGVQALELISQVKTTDDTIPVVAFGPHVAVDLLNAAGERGANAVLTRGRFTADLPQLLAELCGPTPG